MSKTKLFYRCVYLSDSSRRGAIIMDAYKELEEARQKLIDELNETSNDPSFIELQEALQKDVRQSDDHFRRKFTI